MINLFSLWTSRRRNNHSASGLQSADVSVEAEMPAEEETLPSFPWRETVQSGVSTLDSVTESSENGFLEVGNRLRDIYIRTKGISSGLTTMLGNFTSGCSSDSLSGMQSLSDRATQHLGILDKTSKGAISHLRTIRDPIAAIPDLLVEFDHLVSRLRMMGIATRIESARIGLTDNGFEHLAQAVTSLGEGITEKANEVRHHVRTIGEVVDANGKQLVSLQSSHHSLLDIISQDMQSNLELLSEKHEAYVQTVKGIMIKSQDAVNSVNAVVHSIQFHDITHQQVIHVITALKELLEHDADSDETLAEVVPVCLIQAAQLRRAGQEFDSAILSIIASLGSLANAVNMMVLESRQMTNYANETGSTFFNIIEERLHHVVDSLLKDGQTIKGMVASLSTISEMIRRMKEYMDEMAEVGTEIELLALNSRVRAAKVGSNGAALGTIAEAIQRLSSEARAKIDDMVSHMEQLVHVAEDMSSGAGDSMLMTQADAKVEEMTGELNTLIGSFQTSNDESAVVLADTVKRGSTLSEELDSMASHIAVYREIPATFIRVGDELDVIASDLRSSVSASLLEAIDLRLQDLNRRYTMETERRTHAAIMQKDSTLEAELAIASTPDDSGSNIELF